MAYLNKADKAKWELSKYHSKRSCWIKALGGACSQCGQTENLEFDHIDPSTKSFNISKLWSLSDSTVVEELRKCQLLCSGCHKKKSDEEQTGERKHGTHAMYRNGGCRCQECRAFFNTYRRALRMRNKDQL